MTIGKTLLLTLIIGVLLLYAARLLIRMTEILEKNNPWSIILSCFLTLFTIIFVITVLLSP